ncbi:MFS transporter [Candidatus Palauibacter sp.]|uniref:MFS transporter n=1 Tax=Candidatus Palauibacter sp. TaxID=3101350 RepID=UPI003B015435
MSRRTAPEDRISFSHKIAYGVGAFVNNLLAQGIGGMTVVLTLALGMDFRLVGLLGMLPRFFDAITDPLVGFISDRTRSRWGRRRPYLFVGAIASGALFALLWQMPAPTQFRLKLVDYGPDGVYSGGVTGEPVGILEAVGESLREIVTVEVMDDVEDEVTILPPTLVTGGWVGVDVPLSDFDELTTREHLSQILISGDLTEVYVDNVYLYRTDDTSRVVPAGEDRDGPTAPAEAAPAPTVPAADVISFFSDAYDDVRVDFWSTDWDEADVADAEAAGDPIKHYTNLRFAGIDFGEQPVDARAMTHVHMDIWTPEATGEGRSQAYYFWYFLLGSLVFFLAYTIFATPWVALGYELTPDFHERTRLMGVQNFVGNIAFVIAPWFLVVMTNPAWFRNQMAGARFLALAICIAVIVLGVLPAIFLRERVPNTAAAAADREGGIGQGASEFFGGLWKTVRTGPFLLLCVATFLIFNSFIMISAFQFWVFVYHVSGGNVADGASLAGLVGTLGIVAGFAVIAIVTWLGTKVGKRNAFFVSTGISMVGYALKWFCYDPAYPMLALLPAPFLAFGLGGLFTLMGSMIADVVDLDELSTGERREGMFGSVYWWVVKVGQSIALGAGGFLLASTGLDIGLGANQAAETIVLLRAYDAFIPFIASAIAILAIWKYPITEKTALEVRAELERRRGAGTVRRLPPGVRGE